MSEKNKAESPVTCDAPHVDCQFLVTLAHMSVSDGMNQLKAKLYNLIETAVTDDGQRKAMRGLVKGFCVDSFRYIGNGIVSANAMHGNLNLEGSGTEDYWFHMSAMNPSSNVDKLD